ncbi:MAG: NAD-dependent epimerase/dehydratase family protein [Acetobacter sp.]|nr:NAD-dependent epimerase/dehydratase family protein [Acetobacter sp.]
MAEVKVCLVTGAASLIGQHIVAELVAAKHKVIALGDPTDTFIPDVLTKRQIKINTALPITTASFKKYNVQFCFGDVSDISFLASIFSGLAQNDIAIEYVFHLSANKAIQKSSPAAYHPEFIASANVLEVVKAYWQGHKETFKGFFYAAENNAKSGKVETMLNKMNEKDNFPAVIFKDENQPLGAGYKGRTSLASLYRVLTPFAVSNKWESADTEDNYINRITRAVNRFLETPEK